MPTVGDDGVGMPIDMAQQRPRESVDRRRGVTPHAGPEDERLAAKLCYQISHRQSELAVWILNDHVSSGSQYRWHESRRYARPADPLPAQHARVAQSPNRRLLGLP